MEYAGFLKHYIAGEMYMSNERNGATSGKFTWVSLFQ